VHVHYTIDRCDLPVTHHTRRSGSPHTLVLAKTQALFERERAKRKAWTRPARPRDPVPDDPDLRGHWENPELVDRRSLR
jgi:hypothetical protein